MRIPFGTVASHEQVSRQMEIPGGIRQVATAAGQNPITYLIPCHRIICKNGEVGNFSYGKTRKQAMIGWEMAIKGTNAF